MLNITELKKKLKSIHYSNTHLKVLFKNHVSSTNDYLNYQYARDLFPLLVITNNQRAARGRNQKTWVSLNQKSISFSLCFKVNAKQLDLRYLSYLSCTCLLDAMNKNNCEDIKIKWPNDLYHNDKKVSGILIESLSIDKEIYVSLMEEQFKGKEKLIEPNVKALNIGYNYAEENFKDFCEIKVQKSDKTEGLILTSGNDAAGLGCVYGGATVCAWYPITPSTSLAESYNKYSEKLRVEIGTDKNKFAFIQAEDELAAMGMTIGANWNGARAFTATSGPGVSLMSEFIGLAYFAEVPTVLFNVQRGGPSTGMPTRTQQSDILCSAYASHGDTKHVLLIPSDPKECFDFAVEAFDLADRLQTPVIVLLDLDLGMNDWSTKEFEWDDSIEYDKGKVLSKDDLDGIERFGRYLDVDGDGIPYRTYPGTHPEKGAYFTRGTSHDEYAGYTEDGVKNAEMLSRLLKKFQTASSLVPAPVFNQEKNESSMGIIYFGSTDCSMQEALDILDDKNIKIDAMRIRAFPFNLEVWEFIEDHDLLFIVEQNRDGQMRTLIMAEGGIIPDKLVSILCFDGQPITAEHITKKINAHLSGKPALAAS